MFRKQYLCQSFLFSISSIEELKLGNFFNEDIVQYIISIDPYQRAIYGSWIIIFIFLIKNIGIFLSN